KLLADIIETEFGRRIESVEQTVSCCSVTEDLAQTLGAARGTPALRVLKHYRDAARALVIVTSTLYPENRYSIVTTLARSA
ncbi:MAG: UTRA domain-containing protein, partial [Comamonas sp.]